jgi:rhodanese-related sulfurtransferase
VADDLPPLIEPTELCPRLGETDPLLIDRRKKAAYQQLQMPGAVNLDWGNRNETPRETA